MAPPRLHLRLPTSPLQSFDYNPRPLPASSLPIPIASLDTLPVEQALGQRPTQVYNTGALSGLGSNDWPSSPAVFALRAQLNAKSSFVPEVRATASAVVGRLPLAFSPALSTSLGVSPQCCSCRTTHQLLFEVGDSTSGASLMYITGNLLQLTTCSGGVPLQSQLALPSDRLGEAMEIVVALAPNGQATVHVDGLNSGHAMGGNVWTNASPGAFAEVQSSFCGSDGTTSGLDGSGSLAGDYNLRFWSGRLYAASPATRGTLRFLTWW